MSTEPTERPSSTLHFPADVVLGTLYLRGVDGEWQALGPAQGDVPVPADTEVRLDATGLEDTTYLAQLRPGDIQELGLDRGSLSAGMLSDVARVTGLRALYLRGARLADEDLAALAPLARTLELLDLSDTAIGDRALRELQVLDHLEELDLDRTKVSDVGMADVARMSALRELYLSWTAISDPGLEPLVGLRALEVLDLEGTFVTDEGLSIVGRIRDLQELDLGETDVTDEGIRRLSGLTRLTSLDLSSTDITDAALEVVGRFIDLEELSLATTDVTAAGLAHLRHLSRLTSLDVSDTAATDASLGSLREQLPDCRILNLPRQHDEPGPAAL